jgi:hypothetical protein
MYHSMALTINRRSSDLFPIGPPKSTLLPLFTHGVYKSIDCIPDNKGALSEGEVPWIKSRHNKFQDIELSQQLMQTRLITLHVAQGFSLA